MTIHLVTVGISIVTNAAHTGVLGSGPDDTVALAEAGADARVKAALVEATRRDPWGMSAELSAMRPYLEEGSVDAAHLLPTATPACLLAAQVLEEVLQEDHEVPVTRAEVPLAAEDDGSFAVSLRRLWDEVWGFVRERRAEGKDVAINATGGMKPEFAAVYIAGSLAGVPVYYRHERFQRTVVIPPLDVSLAPPELAPTLRRLGEGALEGEEAARFCAGDEARRLERLGLIRVEGGGPAEVQRVTLSRYGRMLLGAVTEPEAHR